MIEQLIMRVFFTRNIAHLAHWRVKGAGSYAAHVALGDFYDSIIDDIDSLVEAYQGKYGIIKNNVPSEKMKEAAIKQLEEDLKWIEENNKSVTKGNAALQNLLDGISDQYMSTLYKLNNLE